MAIIYMVENIFQVKNLEMKEAAIRKHYDQAYGCELKQDLTPLEIDFLYKKLQQLKDTQFVYNVTS